MEFFVLALAQLLIVIYIWRLDRTLQQILRDAQAEPDSENRSRALGVISRAYHQAQQVLGRAELEGIKIAAQSKLETKKLTAAYEREVDENRQKLEQAFLVEADEAYEKFADYLTRLTEHTTNLEKMWSKAAAGELAKFQKDAQDQIKRELDEYQKSQMAALDNNIISLVESTFALVAPKTIKLSDQMDLIYEALEKAKTDKLIS